MIQQLLAEAGRPAIVGPGSRRGGRQRCRSRRGLVQPPFTGELPRISIGPKNFSSPGGAVVGKAHMYAAPAKLAVNRLGACRRLDDAEALGHHGRTSPMPASSTALTRVICIW